MNTNSLLVRYDKDLRLRIHYPEARKEITKDVVRVIRKAPGMNVVAFTFANESKLDHVIDGGRRLGHRGGQRGRLLGHLLDGGAHLGDRGGGLVHGLGELPGVARSGAWGAMLTALRPVFWPSFFSSAGQISANAELITQGAQAQAQAAEETSTSMEEMAASILTVAGNAQSLATYVEETSSSITEMGASIEEVAKSSGNLASTVAEASATIEQMVVSMAQSARNLESLSETEFELPFHENRF